MKLSNLEVTLEEAFEQGKVQGMKEVLEDIINQLQKCNDLNYVYAYVNAYFDIVYKEKNNV